MTLIKTFPDVKVVHLQIYNMVALYYIKNIWVFTRYSECGGRFSVSVSYRINLWKLKHEIFRMICHALSTPNTQNKVFSALVKEIWDYLILNGTTLTGEYLPGILNVEADFQSQSVTDSSLWKLKHEIFRMTWQALGTPDIDFLVSRKSHQLPM